MQPEESPRFFKSQRTWSPTKFHESQIWSYEKSNFLKICFFDIAAWKCTTILFITNYQYILKHPYLSKECGPWGLKYIDFNLRRQPEANLCISHHLRRCSFLLAWAKEGISWVSADSLPLLQSWAGSLAFETFPFRPRGYGIGRWKEEVRRFEGDFSKG